MELIILVNKFEGKLYTGSPWVKHYTELSNDTFVNVSNVAIYPYVTFHGLPESEVAYYLADVKITEKERKALTPHNYHSSCLYNKEVKLIKEIDNRFLIFEDVIEENKGKDVYISNLKHCFLDTLSFKLRQNEKETVSKLLTLPIWNVDYDRKITITNENTSDIEFYCGFENITFDYYMGYNGPEKLRLEYEDLKDLMYSLKPESLEYLLKGLPYFREFKSISEIIPKGFIKYLIDSYNNEKNQMKKYEHLEKLLYAYAEYRKKEEFADELLLALDDTRYALKDPEYEAYEEVEYDAFIYDCDFDILDNGEYTRELRWVDERLEEVADLVNVLPYVTEKSLSILKNYHYPTIENHLHQTFREKLSALYYLGY